MTFLPIPLPRLATRLLPLLALLLCSACARVETLHYLTTPPDSLASDPTAPRFYFDQTYVAPEARDICGRRLTVQVLPPADTLPPAVLAAYPPADWTQWATHYESHVADLMYQSRLFADVCASRDPQTHQPPDLLLRLAVTEWHEGSRAARLVLSLVGPASLLYGATRVQFEAELLDGGHPLLTIADARLHPGGPGIIAWQSARELIPEDLALAAAQLRDDLRKLLGATDPLPGLIPHPAYRYDLPPNRLHCPPTPPQSAAN